jgi:hypothetical protein
MYFDDYSYGHGRLHGNASIGRSTLRMAEESRGLELLLLAMSIGIQIFDEPTDGDIQARFEVIIMVAMQNEVNSSPVISGLAREAV